MWTTRFTIAATDGIWDPAPEANQPQGGSPAIPWGQGELVVTSATLDSGSSAQVKTSASSSTTTSSDDDSNSDDDTSTISSGSLTLSQQNGALTSSKGPTISAIALAVAVAFNL